MQFRLGLCLLACAASIALSSLQAAEFYVGDPIEQDKLQIVPNYLTGIQMDPMPKGMDMGADAIHIEAYVHATRGETHGFPAYAWIPYLTINFTLAKQGSDFKKSGTLAAMTADDGPHYVNNVNMDGPGTYELTYCRRHRMGSFAISTRRPGFLSGGSRSPRIERSPIRARRKKIDRFA